MTKTLPKEMHLHRRRIRRPRTHRFAYPALDPFVPASTLPKEPWDSQVSEFAWQGDHIVNMSVLLQTACHRGARTITHIGRKASTDTSIVQGFGVLFGLCFLE